MRKHSHNSKNQLAREDGLAPPRRGRSPRGAKNNEINPASSNIPSDWYAEKSCAALTNERKHTKQIAKVPRGHKFNTSSTDAIIPTQQIPFSMGRPPENHSSVGAYQQPTRLNCSPTARKYSPAGRMPCGPINPLI